VGIPNRIRRVPGEWKNVGLWEAEDATVRHDAIASLPFSWLSMRVRPMAAHPNDPRQWTA
jgi:muconolactone delta-isomerase